MLSVRIVNHGDDDIECLCEIGKRYVEGEWLEHGWRFNSGQCCDCMNIWDGHADVAMHICDLDEFIEMLQAIRAAKESQRGPIPIQGDPAE